MPGEATDLPTSLLLDLTRIIATVRERKQLFATLFEQLKPIIPLYDTGLLVLDKSGQYWQDWTNVEKYQGHPAAAGLQQRGYDGFQPMDPCVEYCLDHTGIMTLARFQEQYPEHPFGTVRWQAGLRERLFTPLQHRGRKLGVLFLDSEREGTYTEAHLSLFQWIGDLVAVAVANILANEEILEREHEKALLLSLSEDMATIRDREDLLQVILRKIKPLTGFDDAVVSTYSEDYAFYKHFVTLSPPETRAHPLFSQLVGTALPVKDNPDEYTLAQIQTQGVFRWDTDQILTAFPDHPIGHFLQEIKRHYNFYLKLSWGGRLFGFMHFHYQQLPVGVEAKYPLFKSIADQVAVAVANILANEAILERERLAKVLLSISESIASIRDKTELLQVIHHKMKLLFIFDAPGLFIVNADENYSYDLTVLHPTITSDPITLQAHQQIPIERIPYRGSNVEQVMRLEGAHLWNWKTAFEQSGMGHPYLPICFEHGLIYAMVCPLKVGGQKIGFICLNATKNQFTTQQLPLFQTIADQVAVAVANILANEEILQQKVEIESLKNKLEQENLYLQEEVSRQHNLGEIIGSSEPMQAVFREVKQVAATDTTVLILGETGTGKELIARALHRLSPRQARPLVKLNCAALPAQLIESELFGHERGAFTGALERRIGKFEVASGSTLFLDEIGELSLDLQAKLLRAIQEKEIERLGSNKVIHTDVRIVAATNRELDREVREGRFRADLYYRLSVFPLLLPPLRERKEDIPLLAMHFVEKYAQKLGRKITGIASAALKEMLAYDWPGNVREMEHVVERAVLRATITTLKEIGLVNEQSKGAPLFQNSLSGSAALKTLDQVEREAILLALRHCKGRIRGKGGAAELLGIIPNTLDYRMKRLGIVKQHRVAE